MKMTYKIVRYACFIVFVLNSIFAYADSKYNQYSKGVDKILELHKTDPIKAIEKMQKLLDDGGNNKDWDLYVNMLYFRYRFTKDSLKDQEQAQLRFTEFIDGCRLATLKSTSTVASHNIVRYLLKREYDQNVPTEAVERVKEAEDFFVKKNYFRAAEIYNEIVNEYPKYYRARLFLSLSYMNTRRYSVAHEQLETVLKQYPNDIEARYNLIDAYIEEDAFEAARKWCISSILLYPCNGFFARLAEVESEQKRNCMRYWFPRECEVNVMGKDQDPIIAKKNPWVEYRAAKAEIEPFCDENGIIVQSTNLTKSKYAEVYAWEKMLKSPYAIGPVFDCARKMKSENMLECFVLISLFHYDFYAQFQDFVKKNRRYIDAYFANYLTY